MAIEQIAGVRLNGLDVTDSGIDVPPNGAVSDVAVEMTKLRVSTVNPS